MPIESEISALLERKLQAKKQEMIHAWMAFQRNPTAKTFKASEDIPDKLMGEVLDEVTKEVLASSAPTIKENEPSKKTQARRKMTDKHPNRSMGWQFR